MCELNKDSSEWYRIWNKRASHESEFKSEIIDLIKMDGFDGGAGDYSLPNWIKMVNAEVSRHNLSESSELLEIGCGAGALL